MRLRCWRRDLDIVDADSSKVLDHRRRTEGKADNIQSMDRNLEDTFAVDTHRTEAVVGHSLPPAIDLCFADVHIEHWRAHCRRKTVDS